MKKFLCGALIALTAIFMASCKSGGGSSAYSKGGEAPKIDYEAGTVNGKAYDNKNEACWEVSMSVSSKGASGTTTAYSWATEFVIVAMGEQSMYEYAQMGVDASYSYSKNSAEGYEACEKQNEDILGDEY